jgi:hypothetical protein
MSGAEQNLPHSCLIRVGSEHLGTVSVAPLCGLAQPPCTAWLAQFPMMWLTNSEYQAIQGDHTGWGGLWWGSPSGLGQLSSFPFFSDAVCHGILIFVHSQHFPECRCCHPSAHFTAATAMKPTELWGSRGVPHTAVWAGCIKVIRK